MDVFIFFFLIIFLPSLLNIGVSSCETDPPVTQFPFRASPGFEISFKNNKTIIHFLSYRGRGEGGLEVKSISYESRTVSLLDPNNCVHEVFLNLNLSDTPFKYYYALKEYRYLNCSVNLPIPFTQVPCLSSSHGSHVYIVEPGMSVPESCTTMKSIGIPFSYSPYISDNSFGLRLTWDDDDSRNDDHQQKTETESPNSWIDISYYKALRLAMFMFLVLTLAFRKTSYLEEEEEEDEKNQEGNDVETQKLLGDCDSTRACRAGLD